MNHRSQKPLTHDARYDRSGETLFFRLLVGREPSGPPTHKLAVQFHVVEADIGFKRRQFLTEFNIGNHIDSSSHWVSP